MIKKYPNMVRIMVVLAIVASLVAIVASPASAASISFDKAHYADTQTVTMSVFDPAQVGNGGPAGTSTVAVTAKDSSATVVGTLNVVCTELSDNGVEVGTFQVVITPAALKLTVALRGTVSATFGLDTATADIVQMTAPVTGTTLSKVGGSVGIMVNAPSVSSTVVDTISVSVTSTLTTTAVPVTLTETGLATGIYSGSVALIGKGVTPAANQVNVLEPFDMVKVTYGLVTATASVDSGLPESFMNVASASTVTTLPKSITVSGQAGAFTGIISGAVTGTYDSATGVLIITGFTGPNLTIGTTGTVTYTATIPGPGGVVVAPGGSLAATALTAPAITDTNLIFTAAGAQFAGNNISGTITTPATGATSTAAAFTIVGTIGAGAGSILAGTLSATINATLPVTGATAAFITGTIVGTVTGGFVNPAALPAGFGLAGVSQLGLSTDGGATFTTVYIGAPAGAAGAPFAAFAYSWSPANGSFTLVSQATNVLGGVEPMPAAAATGTNRVSVIVETSLPTVTALTVARSDTTTTDTSTPLKVYRGANINISVTASDALSGITAVNVTTDTPAYVLPGLALPGAIPAVVGGVDTYGNGNYKLSNVAVTANPGTYTITVKATNGAGLVSAASTVQIQVVDDTTAPTISNAQVLYTVGIQGLNSGVDTVEIVAKATDDIAGINTVTLTDVKALTGAVVTTTVGMVLDAGAASPWKGYYRSGPVAVAATVAAGTYTITIKATDKVTFGTANSSTATVSVEVAATRTKFQFNLVAGKNYISFPQPVIGAGGTTKVFDVLGNAAGTLAPSVNKIYSYVGGVPVAWANHETATGSGLYIWTSTSATDTMDMKAGIGYIIDMKAAATLVVNFATIDATAPPPSISLGAGWNLIGYSSRNMTVASTQVGVYLGSLSNNWAVLYDSSFNQARPSILAASGAIAVGAFAVDAGGAPIAQIGKSYWIYLAASGVLVP